MKKQATIYDIAKHCNVSPATVSRVLGKSSYPVKAATREKILQAAKQMKYVPNLIGQSLKTNVSRDIGVILPNITNPIYTQLIQGIYDNAAKLDYQVLLCDSHRTPVQENKNIDSLISKRVGGIILASISKQSEAARRALEFGVRVVTIEQELPLDCIHVGFDYRAAGYLATKTLIASGHRKIGFIGAPLDRSSRLQMLDGFKSCLIDHGLTPNDTFIMLSENESEMSSIYELNNGIAHAQHCLSLMQRPTGYVCINDITALGFIRGFTESGLRVPEDVSVIGFDNIPYCSLVSKGLTTIDQHAYEMGSIASDILIKQITNPDTVQYSVTLAPELVTRGSVMSIASE